MSARTYRNSPRRFILQRTHHTRYTVLSGFRDHPAAVHPSIYLIRLYTYPVRFRHRSRIGDGDREPQ